MYIYVRQKDGRYGVVPLYLVLCYVILIGLACAVPGLIMKRFEVVGIGLGVGLMLSFLLLLVTWIRNDWRFSRTVNMQFTIKAKRTLKLTK